MPVITQGKTNWKFIIIVFILAAIIGGGILVYTYWWLPKHEVGPPKLIIENPKSGSQIYRNDEYGFEITMPDSWTGYSIITAEWTGTGLNNGKQYNGPEVIIRNPKWATSSPWQDINVYVFTKEEWQLNESENLGIFAAPIGPSKLGENQLYVFGLPPRWIGFTDNLGQDEAQQIVKTFKAFDSTTNLQTYRNNAYGLEFKYPKNWKFQEYYYPKEIFDPLEIMEVGIDPASLISEKEAQTLDIVPGLVSILFDSGNKEAPGIAKASYADLSLPEINIGAFNSIKAKKYEEFTGNDGPNPAYYNKHLIQYTVLINDSKLIRIYYTSNLNDTYLQNFSQILSTFKFTK
jgi:hypothetical protein